MDDPEVTVNVEVEPNEPSEDANNNGVPDSQETGVALERATNAADDANEAQQTADNAQEIASVAAEVAFDAEGRIAQMEQVLGQTVNAVSQMGETLVQLRDLVTANAQATAQQMETQMRGTQPPDEAPASNHWLDRKLGW